MASLKEMRNRIGSVKATQKITKALQMVAAAKLRRSQDAAQNARPYAERMAAVIANLASGVSGEGAPKLLVGTGSDQRHLIVVATSDRGLAGGFNSSIVRAARERIARLTSEGKDVRILTLGRKARDQLKRLDRSVGAYETGGNPSLAVAEEVSAKIRELFAAGEVDVVTLYFSKFKSVISQTAVGVQLIPAQVEASAASIDLKGAVYEYEPDEETILEELLPRNITTQIFSAMLENQAGFYAGDMISALTLKYNRSRQAQITKELIEIISGAEAL